MFDTQLRVDYDTWIRNITHSAGADWVIHREGAGAHIRFPLLVGADRVTRQIFLAHFRVQNRRAEDPSHESRAIGEGTNILRRTDQRVLYHRWILWMR